MKYWKETVALQLVEELYLQGQFKVAMYIVTYTNCNYAMANDTLFYHNYVHAHVLKFMMPNFTAI